MQMKQCVDCPPDSPKPVSEFWANRAGRTRDGLMSRCKTHAKMARDKWMTKAKESEYNERRYRSDPERWIQQSARWRVDNSETYAALHRRNEAARRARKLDQFVEQVDALLVLELCDGVCGICEEDVDPLDFHVDHIIPLARGGDHSYANTQPAHPVCNLRKWAHI